MSFCLEVHCHHPPAISSLTEEVSSGLSFLAHRTQLQHEDPWVDNGGQFWPDTGQPDGQIYTQRHLATSRAFFHCETIDWGWGRKVPPASTKQRAGRLPSILQGTEEPPGTRTFFRLKGVETWISGTITSQA